MAGSARAGPRSEQLRFAQDRCGRIGPKWSAGGWLSQLKILAGVLTVDGPDREVAIGVEYLSYWPGKNEPWTVTEYLGKRVLYSVPPLTT
jgi:hypothetical protein